MESSEIEVYYDVERKTSFGWVDYQQGLGTLEEALECAKELSEINIPYKILKRTYETFLTIE